MYFYNYILLAGFVCLLFNRNTRFPASVFLLGWVVYFATTFGAEYKLYFLASATIETVISVILNAKYRLVSWLGYSLLLLNIVGLILHINNIKFYYDIAYALISCAQFSLLLLRIIPNGICRLHNEHFMVRVINYDSRGSYARMCKDIKTKG